jgi:glucosamine--fructose-6-phosphate aminotransferase (isomerizing)
MSSMRDTMGTQPEALARILNDRGPVERAADRLVGHRILLVGTGSSSHAANQGAWLLRRAGLEAWAVQAADAAAGETSPGAGDALVLISHRGNKLRTSEVLQRARSMRVPTVVISRQGNPDADLETVPEETSSAHTASLLGSLLRLAQLADHLGASLDRLADVPGAVAAELDEGPTGVAPPSRLLEFAGVGINAWTAAEGSLKIRETSYVASEGLACEAVLHGPAVALGSADALVCLDGGSGTQRLDDLAKVVAVQGARVHRFSRPALGEALSIFALTVVVQKIAVEAAEARGTNPDSFGRDLPGRAAAWASIRL